MDLFDFKKDDGTLRPLADRMRPRSLEEFVGQEHLIYKNSLLQRAIVADRLGSCIFFGPPGVGKTTLAAIVAGETKGSFVKMNAVTSGVADAKKVIEEARERRKLYGKKTYLLLDECHRWNKAQSDCVLSAIEDGSIIFIGSTTENPHFAMTRAIVSRCRVFELKPLKAEDIKTGLKRAVADKERGLGNYNLRVTEGALEHFARAAGGDLRSALGGLELAVMTTPAGRDGEIVIDEEAASQSVMQKCLSIDESSYYDMLSAFCKALRGSDPDAALYWAFRLTEAGVDPKILFRRLYAHASEDVGMADSSALIFVDAAERAYENIGFPEGELSLAHAIIYVACAPKSNGVYLAKGAAEDAVRRTGASYVPLHLRNNNNSSLDKPAFPYKYPHDYGGYVTQQYMPEELAGEIFYRPKGEGEEVNIKARLDDFARRAANREGGKGE